MHHLYQHSGVLGGTLLAPILQAMGYLSVAVFFFISGYGLEISFLSKGEAYVTTLPKKRMLPLYLNCLVLMAIYIFIAICVGDKISLRLILTSLTWGGTIIANGWYLQCILVLYLIYWVVSIFSKSSRYVILFVLMALYCILCVCAGLGLTAYQSIYAFLLGVVWAERKKRIDAFISTHWIINTISFFMLFSVTFLLGRRIAILNMMSAVFFVVLVLLLIMKIRVNNAVTRWLGKYSFEIYVMQGIPLLLLHSNVIYIENQWIYVLLCTIITLILAVAIYPVFQLINKAVKRELIA